MWSRAAGPWPGGCSRGASHAGGSDEGRQSCSLWCSRCGCHQPAVGGHARLGAPAQHRVDPWYVDGPRPRCGSIWARPRHPPHHGRSLRPALRLPLRARVGSRRRDDGDDPVGHPRILDRHADRTRAAGAFADPGEVARSWSVLLAPRPRRSPLLLRRAPAVWSDRRSWLRSRRRGATVGADGSPLTSPRGGRARSHARETGTSVVR